jgi:hypothetical protein
VTAFWRWLTRPAISVADGLACVTLTLGADALKLGLHLSWPAILAIAWGGSAIALFGIGFIKGLVRSMRS